MSDNECSDELTFAEQRIASGWRVMYRNHRWWVYHPAHRAPEAYATPEAAIVAYKANVFNHLFPSSGDRR